MLLIGMKNIHVQNAIGILSLLASPAGVFMGDRSPQKTPAGEATPHWLTLVGLAVDLILLLVLVCTWRRGGHVGNQEQKHFSPLGTKCHFHANSSRKNSVVLTTDMAALSRGCKPRVVNQSF